MAERDAADYKHCHFEVVPNRSAATLQPRILARVD